MCALAELLAICLFAIAAPMLVWAALLQQRFYRLLKKRHPFVWLSFGEHGYFKYDESPRESAAGWYLLTGGYAYLNDELVNRSGRTARIVSFSAFGLALSWFLAMQLPTYDSALSCLGRQVSAILHAN